MEMVKDTFTEEDVEEARTDGYNDGYNDGLQEGRDDGYSDGFEDGQNDVDTFEYEKDQLYDLIVSDLAQDVERELWLMRELREANPDLQKVFETVQRVIKDAENV